MKLEAKNITAGYGEKIIIDDVNLDIAEGEIITLLGANGCGKSTLLKSLGRILKIKSGVILLDGKSIAKFNNQNLARNLAILTQLHHISGNLTVEELVSYGRFPHRRMQIVNSKHDREIIEMSLEMTQMTILRKRALTTLSGGERQRAWIAMTLAQEPKILLLDEPTTFLDICHQFEIIDMIKKMNKQFNITVIMVLHDLNLASSCSDKIVMLKDKKIRYIGTPKDVITVANVRDIFNINSKITIDENGIPYCIATGKFEALIKK